MLKCDTKFLTDDFKTKSIEHLVQGRIQDFKRGAGWQTIFIEGC